MTLILGYEMKYELNEKEFSKIHDTILQITNVFCGTMIEIHKMKHKIDLMRIEMDMKRHRSEYMSPEDFVSDDPIDFPTPVNHMNVVAGGKGSRFTEPELTDHQAKGKIELEQLITMWMVGFRDEDAEQPDRASYMEELGRDPKRAGSLVSYCMAVGSLTVAIYIVCHEEAEYGHIDADLIDDEYIRYLAANIMQVASVYLQPLADLFIYPNPLS